MYNDGMAAASAVDNVAVTIVLIYLLLLGVMLLGSIVDYIIRGIGMYKMGKAEGKTNSWLAFIPFARTYFQGELSGDIALKKRSIKNPGVWMIVVPIIYGVIIGVIYFLFWVAIVVGSFSMTGSMGHYGSHGMDAVSGMVGMLIVFIVVFVLFTTVFTAVTKVLRVLVNRQIYERYTVTNMAILHAVLGTIIPFYESVCLFIFGRRAESEKEQQYMDDSQENIIE